ncbi:MAG: exodeoxyribonuclease VII large subunit, partial [Elusimicrobia bacterium]|nr:exodeoxyribonuclease VII large subunit [Elusimicrobiota bacterium]
MEAAKNAMTSGFPEEMNFEARPPASVRAAPAKVFTVTELNNCIKNLLEEAFPEVWVEGELSNLKTYPSGHVYFTLKDCESQIAAVMFRGHAQHLKFSLEPGLLVLARARPSAYVKRGGLQVIITALEPKRMGALQLAFEQLKAKLAREGLFDDGRKKPLPMLPQRIGVVTSLQGAA